MDPFTESKYSKREERIEVPPEITHEKKSYAEILADIGMNTKDLIQSDIELVFSEFRKIKSKLGEESKNFIVYTILLMLSAIPLMAFAIIGLGILLNNHYWLSALIIGAVFALVGVFGILRVTSRLKKMDLDFSNTKRTVEKEKRILAAELRNIKTAIKGESHGFQN